MSRLVAIVAMVLLMTVLMVVPAFAQTPGGGDAFGEHVSSMAPERPRDHGREFGECVSSMARTGTCPHHS